MCRVKTLNRFYFGVSFSWVAHERYRGSPGSKQEFDTKIYTFYFPRSVSKVFGVSQGLICIVSFKVLKLSFSTMKLNLLGPLSQQVTVIVKSKTSYSCFLVSYFFHFIPSTRLSLVGFFRPDYYVRQITTTIL